MRKKTKKHDDSVLQIMSEAGKTNFPVRDTCSLAGITLEEFAESEDLQNAYRTAQLQTALAIRSKLVDEAMKGDIKSVRMFLEHFQTQILPRVEDMPDDD